MYVRIVPVYHMWSQRSFELPLLKNRNSLMFCIETSLREKYIVHYFGLIFLFYLMWKNLLLLHKDGIYSASFRCDPTCGISDYIVNSRRYEKQVDGYAYIIDADKRYIPRRILFTKTFRRNISVFYCETMSFGSSQVFGFSYKIAYPANLDISVRYTEVLRRHLSSRLSYSKVKKFLAIGMIIILNVHQKFFTHFAVRKKNARPNSVHLSRVKLCPGKRKIFAYVDHY